MKRLQTIFAWAALVAVAVAIVLALPHAPVDHITQFSPWLIPIAGVAFNKHNQFVEDQAEKVHNLGADALTYAATNTAPVATNSILANLTQITYTNLSARVPTISSSAQSSGTYKLVLADLVLTASGGSVGPLRYIDLYNDTPTSPADPLIGWWDYGSSITLADGETLTIDADATNGVLQVA